MQRALEDAARGSASFTTDDWLYFDEGVPRGHREPDAQPLSTQERSYELLRPSLDVHPEYSRARPKFGVDLTSLTIPTTFNVDKSTLDTLFADTTRFSSLLDLPPWAYLKYVPWLFGIR